MYIKYPNAGHKFWKERLISESLSNNNSFCNNYWHNLIYLILNRKRVRDYKFNNTAIINTYNLFSPINKPTIINNIENIRILEILGIDYNKNRRIVVRRPTPILEDVNEEKW